jgi:hypothetical protein
MYRAVYKWILVYTLKGAKIRRWQGRKTGLECGEFGQKVG